MSAKHKLAMRREMTVGIFTMERNPDSAPGHVSYSRRQTGTIGGTISVEVDWDALIDLLGPKALRSKGRKAVSQHGAIIVRASAVEVRK